MPGAVNCGESATALSGPVGPGGKACPDRAASIDSPRHNYTGDPYFTDGYRLVIFISQRNRAVTLEKVKMLEWEVRDVPPTR